MILTPAQKEIAKDTHRFRVVNCGRRFGKTTIAILEIVAKAVGKKDRYIAYIAPTYQQARDIAWRELKKVCLPITINLNESRLEITVKTKDGGESIIWLRGWESVETLRGQRFDFVVIDEVAMMRNFESNWQEVIRPTLTDTKGEILFISTPKGFNHFYDLYNLESEDQDFKSFHFTSYDNPFIPKEEIDKAKEELTEDRFAQEYLADFRKTEGLVFKEFNRNIHLVDGVPENTTIIRRMGGVDFGFTNPAAVIEVKKDKLARYWIEERLYKTGLTDAQLADYVAALKWEACYPDPENPAAIEELKRRNVNTREVVKGKDSIPNGINTIREMFKTGRLRINRNSINLIWELETYAYPERKNDKPESELPIHDNCHAIDALRYCLMMDNALTVEQVRPPNLEAPRERTNIAL